MVQHFSLHPPPTNPFTFNMGGHNKKLWMCVVDNIKSRKEKKKTSTNDETVYKIRHTHTYTERTREREKRNLDM